MKHNDCKPNCDFEKAVSPRRATFICAKCGRDFSLEYLFWAQAEYPKLFERQQNEIHTMPTGARTEETHSKLS